MGEELLGAESKHTACWQGREQLVKMLFLLPAAGLQQQRGTWGAFRSSCCFVHSKEPLLGARCDGAAPVRGAEGLHGVWKC